MAKRVFHVEIRPAQKSDMPAIRELIRLFPEQLVQQNLPRVTSFFVAFTRIFRITVSLPS